MTPIDLLRQHNPEALTADGFDEALVGVLLRPNRPAVAVYDIQTCLDILVRDGMDDEEAREYFEFNTLGAYVGPLTPIYVDFRWPHDAH